MEPRNRRSDSRTSYSMKEFVVAVTAGLFIMWLAEWQTIEMPAGGNFIFLVLALVGAQVLSAKVGVWVGVLWKKRRSRGA